MSGYAMAWWLVGGCGVVCLVAVAMLFRHQARTWVLASLVLLMAAVLLVPAPHPGAPGVWAPAFVIALFEGLFQSNGNPTVALRILVVSCLCAIAIVVTALLILWLRAKRSAVERS